MSLQFSFPRQQLCQIAQSDSPRLAEAALWIAQEEYPTLDLAIALDQLDQMAARIEPQLPNPPYPLKVIQVINDYLFGQEGFIGNEAEYYDPRNSYLNEVLHRRKGIPITLSLVYLDIAQQLDFPMEGINFPGHFLIRPLVADCEFLVDPFNQGEILFAEDCRERLRLMVGNEIELSPSFFAGITPQSFLIRMLKNLKHIYLNQQDLSRSLAASERILLVDPTQSLELRDRGLLYYQLGRWLEARQDLEEYLEHHGQSDDHTLLHRLIKQINQEFSS